MSSLIIILLAFSFAFSSFSKVFPLIEGVSNYLLAILIISQVFFLNKIDFKTYVAMVLVFLFQLLFIYYGVEIRGGAFDVALSNSRYLLIILIFPAVSFLAQQNKISDLLASLSVVVQTKAAFVLFVFILKSFEVSFLDELYLNSNLLIHPMLGFIRVFDSFVVFFPLAFYKLKSKSLFYQFPLILMITAYVVVSMSLGVILIYVLFTLLYFYYFYLAPKLTHKNRMSLVLASTFLTFIGYLTVTSGFFIELMKAIGVYQVLIDKLITSLPVKSAQVYWLIDNFSLFGEGVGKEFYIDGRVDTMLEVLHVYWLATYGLIGGILFYLVVIVLPSWKLFLSNREEEILVPYLTFITIMLCSFTNPYALSGFVFLFLLLVYAFRSEQKQTDF